MDDVGARCRELGAFLRARREQLRPDDVGLAANGRRRTPGLRREEVAVLAGVSVDYLTRLEQGRDVKPSGSVVRAIADALRLTDDERTYLATLTLAGSAPEMCPTVTTMATQVAPNVQAMIDALDPAPAFLTGPAAHVLAANEAWRTLVEPLGLADGDSPNLATYVFTDERAHTTLAEWDRVADEQVGQLRHASLRWGRDPAFVALLHELQTVAAFEDRWSAHPVGDPQRGLILLRHPGVGELRLRFEVLQLPHDGDQRLTSWFPADDASDGRLRRATHLRPLQAVRPA